MDNLKSITVELEAWICPVGYQVIATDLSEGGIASLIAASVKSIHVVVPKEPERLEKQCIQRVSPIWRELVRLDNIRRVARQSKVHRVIELFCGMYGIPSKGPTRLETPVKEAFIADIVTEAKRMVDAIKNSEAGRVEAPEDVIVAFQRDITFRTAVTAGDMYLTFTNTLVAGWFSLINSRVDPNRVCGFCQGINVARAGSDFCTAYCRDKHHKQEMRKR